MVIQGSGLEEEFYTASNTMIQRGIEAQRTYVHDQGVLPDTGTMVDLGTLVINSDTEIDSGDLDTMKRNLLPCAFYIFQQLSFYLLQVMILVLNLPLRRLPPCHMNIRLLL